MRILLLISLILFGVAADARAQSDPNPSTTSTAWLKREQAEIDLRKAKKLLQQKKLDEAARELASAFEWVTTYDIAAALDDVERQLGLYAKAATHLRFALMHLPMSAAQRERDAIRNHFVEVRGKVSALGIEVNPAGAEVYVGGEFLGVAPLGDEVFGMPGEAAVEARMAGYAPIVKKVLLSAGGTEKNVSAVSLLFCGLDCGKDWAYAGDTQASDPAIKGGSGANAGSGDLINGNLDGTGTTNPKCMSAVGGNGGAGFVDHGEDGTDGTPALASL